MDPKAWMQVFRQLHEKSKAGALDGEEQKTFKGMKEELTKALIGARKAGDPDRAEKEGLWVPAMLQVEVAGFGGKAKYMSYLASWTGIDLRSDASLPVGTEVKMALKIPDGKPLLEVEGRVAFSKKLAGAGKTGIDYVGLDEEAKQRIDQAMWTAVLATIP